MGRNSRIEWTHHTFNPWWGCSKVSPACRNCYAESWAGRLGFSIWGDRSPRRFFGEEHWAEPIGWNREAEVNGERRRVFCASMADVFEDRKDLNSWRDRLWSLIERTTWLDWLLLTKRPECIEFCVPWSAGWPPNAWLGTTIETQGWALKRIPDLLKHPAVLRFVSCEPLLGPLDLKCWLSQPNSAKSRQDIRGIDWVIAGGESGPRARPMNPAWAEDLRDQCTNAGVPFHFKQWGHWRPAGDRDAPGARTVRVQGRNGGLVTLVKLGKKAAGRELAGKVWDAVPEPGIPMAR